MSALTPDAPPSMDNRVPDSTDLPELTVSALLLGTVLGIIFGASSLYLSLRVGMTVSASIPVAVLSIALFRLMGRGKGRILENNIVQTAGSAGESIAFGVGVTMPALMILGYDLEQSLFRFAGIPITRVMLVACLGGLLGILLMIPLRRAFIVRQHDKLIYPEGTACAKVLVAGEEGGAGAKPVVVGLGIGFVYQILMQGLRLWQETPARAIRGLRGGFATSEMSPALLGVGYIIGFRIAAIMVGGGLLASFVITPIFGMFLPDPPLDPGKTRTNLETTIALWEQIRAEYVLYIGAGAVATGGIISLVQSMPTIWSGLVGGLRDIGSKGNGNGAVPARLRTERDLPLWVVALGIFALIGAIAATDLIPTSIAGRVVGSGLIVLLGFLFVTVSSRLTGEIGSSSNPISGMTVATLLLTCLVFYLMEWIGPGYRLAALSIAGIVCVASSNGGTTSQDLKTGFLVGATPRNQQIAILVGALTSALVIGFTLLWLNQASTVYTKLPENLPKIAAPPSAPGDEIESRDGKVYRVWRLTGALKDDAGKTVALPGKYLVEPETGHVAYLVDPGINGRIKTLDDGTTTVTKYSAPKASLMALIIRGIMREEGSADPPLPWGLVMIGAAIAIVLQLSGVPALAFSVGVYLPLSASMPIFLGGAVRYAVDKMKRTAAEESDSSPAVLLSSGYIAGGSIAATLVAFLAFIPGATAAIGLARFLPASYNESPIPALVAFFALVLVLLLTGAGVLLRDREPKAVEEIQAREENL